MRAWEDLTNVQFPMLNSHPKGEAAACVRSCPASVEHLAIRHPLRMRIEHWELSIGQIPGRIHEKPCGTRWLPHLTLPRSAEVPTNRDGPPNRICLARTGRLKLGGGGLYADTLARGCPESPRHHRAIRRFSRGFSNALQRSMAGAAADSN